MASSVAVIDCNPLPVGLLDFSGEKKAAENQLSWITENELNLDYYILERSADGISWEQVATVMPDDPVEGRHVYFVSDPFFKRDAINYYRLIQKETDGQKLAAENLVSIDNRIRSKKIAYRTNLLGQVVSENQKGLVILVYEDGSSEKVLLED